MPKTHPLTQHDSQPLVEVQAEDGRGADPDKRAGGSIDVRPSRRTVDLLYELISHQENAYQAAWELATEEWNLPEAEARLKEPSSVNPTLNPHSSRLVTSE